MSEQVGSVTRKKSSDFHGGIRFQSSFTIRWELEDKTFLKIDITCLDDSLKYRIMVIKTNEDFIPFSNSVTFRKPGGTVLVTAPELIPGCQMSRPRGRFARSKASNPHPLPTLPPHGIYIDTCITSCTSGLVNQVFIHIFGICAKFLV